MIKEPPIFSIIRSPTNESSVRYVGFPKDFFDFLSTLLDFTSVNIVDISSKRFKKLRLYLISRYNRRYSFVEVTPTMVNNKGSIDEAIIDQILQKVILSFA